MAPVLPVRDRRALRVARAVLVAGGLLLPASGAYAGAEVAAPPVRIAGLVALDFDVESRWTLSGAWIDPVGDACGGDTSEAPYLVNRGLERNVDGSLAHWGVDLCNRRAGGPVRAAANGIVVLALNDSRNGYGSHVVLAHRLDRACFVYTVYAHLLPGSIEVHTGQEVAAGQAIGRVGRSGRASTDHLHFEVRIPSDLGTRWEKCEPVDPIAFLEERRSCRSDDTTWARPYLEWAERGALVDRQAKGEAPLRRHQWWRMLARVTPVPIDSLPIDPVDLRHALVARDLLPVDEPHQDGPLDWRETARDLARLREHGLRIPAFLEAASAHRALCEHRLRTSSPSQDPERLSRIDGAPSVAEACMILADLSAHAGAEPMGADQR